jgi:hypothetical protein
MQPNLNGVFNASSPYFSILVIVVMLLFIWTVWGSKERLIIEGLPAAPIFTLAPLTAGAANAVLTIATTMRIAKDGVITIILPPEMEVPTTNPTINPSAFGKVDSISNVCDSDDLEKLLARGIPEIRKCAQQNTINIIMNTASLTTDQLKVDQPISFSLTGFKIPSYATSLKFGITTSADPSLLKNAEITITGGTGTPPSGGTDGDVTACNFGITLSDETPGAKLVTANYAFSFTNGGNLATFTIKSGSKMYFLFSDDFDLPSIANIRVIVNKKTALSSEKGEYTLIYKYKCSEFKSAASLAIPSLLGMSASDVLKSDKKMCAKYYTLTLNKDILVDQGALMMSLSGIKNPPYYSPPAGEGKRDYLVKPFNSSLCVLNLNTTLISGKYLMVPSPSTYANAGFYFRGNYPIKNTGASSNDDDHGDDTVSKGGSSGKSHVSSSSSRATRAANVYTVNYFYDGQGAGEYGHIAQPQIFGRDPYTYNKYKTGVMGSTSDASIAKHYKDYAKYNQRQSIGQIAPLMGVAPSTLNGGVQPYNSEIHF